jgi:hypothetical protein
MKTASRPKNPMARNVLTALREAIAQVVEKHRREGRPLAVWQDGKAVLVPPGGPSIVREATANYRTRRHRSG